MSLKWKEERNNALKPPAYVGLDGRAKLRVYSMLGIPDKWQWDLMIPYKVKMTGQASNPETAKRDAESAFAWALNTYPASKGA